jgi:cysteine-S-conjugate beta-lyase
MKKDTLLTHSGRDPGRFDGMVNPPVYRGSTVLFENLAALERANRDRFAAFRYGRYGTPNTRALEEALAAVEGGYRAVLAPGGLAAITFALTALLEAGDHLLVADAVYGPTRRFCDHQLKAMGVRTTYYDPTVGASIETLMQPRTRVVFCESPGSNTFEVQDLPAIAEAAHRHGALVVADNTWATPLGIDAFALGIDVSIHAATKYIGGHSDIMLGTVSAAEPLWRRIREHVADWGVCVSPDDCYLGLRGLRTLSVRLDRHEASGLRVARFLEAHPRVARVIHPALPSHPQHALWKRDFKRACGLFSIELATFDPAAVARFVEALQLFGLGYSWGGYESLALPADPSRSRTATRYEARGALVRLHVGLEDPDDLIADLARGFEAMEAG